MVFFSDNKESLHLLLNEIKEYMASLKLDLKPNYQVFPIAENRYDKSGRGLSFLGFVFYHNQTLIRKNVKQNFCRAVAKMRGKDISVEDYKQRGASWYG